MNDLAEHRGDARASNGPTEGLSREFTHDRQEEARHRQEELERGGDSGEVTEGLARQFGIDQHKRAQEIAGDESGTNQADE